MTKTRRRFLRDAAVLGTGAKLAGCLEDGGCSGVTLTTNIEEDDDYEYIEFEEGEAGFRGLEVYGDERARIEIIDRDGEKYRSEISEAEFDFSKVHENLEYLPEAEHINIGEGDYGPIELYFEEKGDCKFNATREQSL